MELPWKPLLIVYVPDDVMAVGKMQICYVIFH